VTPLVGREAEMARLGALVDELRAGRGQIVFISGDAGIGKTRLLAELRALAEPSVTWLGGTCVSYEHDLRSGPFGHMVRSWLGLGEGEPEVAVRMRLRAKLGALLGRGRTRYCPAWPACWAFGSKTRVRRPTRLPPDEPVAVAYTRWVEALGLSGPVVLAVDDLNWAEPATAELAQALLGLTDRGPLMVVAAFRPDPQSSAWRVRMTGPVGVLRTGRSNFRWPRCLPTRAGRSPTCSCRRAWSTTSLATA
jgi:hypothetical protein